jgi:hypothetical protein
MTFHVYIDVSKWSLLVRDIRVPSIVFVGCIGPAFLCVLTIGLIYVYVNLPFWTHGSELQAAIEQFDKVQAAVFRGDTPPSALEDVAIDPLLGWLFDELSGERSSFYSNLTDSAAIPIARVREYTNECSVVIVDVYHNSQDVAFILYKIKGTWKVGRIVPDHNAGLVGLLPLRTC